MEKIGGVMGMGGAGDEEAMAASGPFSYWPRIQEGEHIPSEVNAPACKLPEDVYSSADEIVEMSR